MRSRSRGLAPSSLPGSTWDLGTDGILRTLTATTGTGFEAVATWEAASKPRLVTWSWPKLIKDAVEGFALTDVHQVPRALWCSQRGVLRLPSGHVYELGYLEVHPDDRGSTVSYLALAIAASRAVELEASGMVLASISEEKVQAFYEYAGGQKGKVKGWRTHPALVPYFFSKDALQALQQDANGWRAIT
jgi:hypothetical protein